MDYEKQTLSTEVRSRHTPGKRLLTFFLVFVMILQMCPMQALALWDGSGDSSGGSLGNVDGTFWMLGTTATDSIIGYRFSVYDDQGEKMGRSVDIDFYHGYDDAYRYRYQKTDGTYDKKSHIDLNREYQKYAKNEAMAPTLGNSILIAEDTEANTAYDVYWDTSLKGIDPADIGDTWLTPDMANDVAKKYCGAASYNSTTDYIICEPLFLVYLQDAYYTLTIAELAVYQAGTVEAIRKTYVKSDGTMYEDTNGWTNVLPYGSTSNLYLNNIGIYTSGVFPRFLYAVNEYSVLGTTPVCEETYSSSNTDGNLYTDGSSNKTLVLPGAHKASTNNYRNTAASLLQYQVGMAVYTDAPENTFYTVNHHLLNATGNEVSVETETVDGVAIGKSITLANCAKSYTGYTYDHAEVGGVTQTTATTLAGGGLSIDLYYKAASTYTVTLIKTTGINTWYAQGDYLSVSESGNTKVYTCYAGTTLTIAATAAANYGFMGWDCEFADGASTSLDSDWTSFTLRISQNAVFTAKAAINTYTVTWKNWDGTVLETDTGVAYGTTPTYNSATPARAADAQYSYTFTGWSPAISPVTGDITYTAQFSNGTNSYTVTWKNWDGTVLETDTGVAYGTTPTYNSATPTRSATAQYTYTFTGWSPAISPVTGNVTYTAQFKEATRTYTVTWVNHDGTVLEKDYGVAYGTTPTYNSTTPTKSADAQYSYTFSVWSPAISPVTGDVTYTAQFTAATRKYTVTVIAGTGITSVTGGNTYDYGTSVTINATPASGYSWGSWNGTFYTTTQKYTFTVTQDVTVTASAAASGYTMYFADNINLITGLAAASSTTTEGITYSIDSNGAITVTSSRNDGYGFTPIRVYLEAGTTYAFTCDSDDAWLRGGSDGVEAYWMLDGQYNLYYGMTDKSCVFTPSTTGTYWLRLDVNASGETHKFYNISISKVVDAKSVTYGAALGTLPTVSRNGYTHMGWYSGHATRDNSIAYRNSPWIYYADAFGDLYNAFQYNEASLRNHYSDYGQGEGRRISEYISTDTYGNSSDIVVFAGWDANVIKLTLDGNGGSGHTATVYYRYGINAFYTDAALTQQVTAITRPVRIGYTYNTSLGFTGDGSSGGSNGERYIAYDSVEFASDLCTDIYKDATLYANWTINSYYLDVNGWLDGASSGNISSFGTCDVYINGSLVADDVTDYWTAWPHGTTYEIKDIKNTTGHTYHGVYSGSISGTITATANVVLNFTTNQVRSAYHPNGGTVSASNCGYNQWGWITVDSETWFHYINYGNSDDPYNASTFGLTRAGYTFGGWKVHSTGTVLNQDTTYDSTVYADETSSSKTTANTSLVNCYLYAVWSLNTYTITYDEAGGSAVADQTYTIETNLTLAAAPKRVGYIFMGWKVTTSDGNWTSGTTYDTSKNVGTGMYGNITLTAQWTAITYQIKYDPNPPTDSDDNALPYSGTMANSSHTYDVAQNLTKNTYGVSHYTFQGWNTAADGSGTPYDDGKSIVNLTAENGAVITLYAQWKPNSYTISCNQMGGSGGTSRFYQIWDNCFSLKAGDASNSVTSITVPTRKGYVFAGYYSGTNGNGAMLVDAGGTITVDPTYFTKATAIYAYWLKLDVAITDITLKYKGTNGAMYEIADITDIDYGTRVYMYYTIKNDSVAGEYFFGSWMDCDECADGRGSCCFKGKVYEAGVASNMTQVVNAYRDKGVSYIVRDENGTQDFVLDVGEDYTFCAYSWIPSIGAFTPRGYVYLKNHAGDASMEYNTLNNTRTLSAAATFDVELVEIYLADENGVRLSDTWMIAGKKVYVHHVYRNNSLGRISVTLYQDVHGDGTPLDDIGAEYCSLETHVTSTAITGKAIRDVVAAVFTPGTNGSYTFHGGIYRYGYTADTEKYETDIDNNELILTVTGINAPTIEIVDVDCYLRENTETITSFEITNSDVIPFVSDDMLRVIMTVYDSDGNEVLTMQQDTVCPAGEKQLVWFRWTVPAGKEAYTIKAVLRSARYLVDYGIFDDCSDVRNAVESEHLSSPDTVYEATRPSDWFSPGKPTAKAASITWYQWSYNTSTKVFVKTEYGITVTPGTATITPDSATAYIKGNTWYMKSGYGFFLNAADVTVSSLDGYVMPDADAYTGCQWSYAAWPEFMYQATISIGKFKNQNGLSTLEKVENGWELYPFGNYGRKHFTPIWYPDGSYFAQVVQSEIWTPMGMLTVSCATEEIRIEGNMYDDWYIS